MQDQLKGSICYLAGPIDFSSDKGVGYRQQIMKELKGLDIIFLDPTEKLEGLTPDVGVEQAKIDRLKREGKWEELRAFMKKVVRSDLRCIDCSDFVIAYIDPDIHQCGTYHEIVCAINQKKPVLTIMKGGRIRASSWLFGILRPDAMFDSVEDLVGYFNHPEFVLDERWVLFREQLFRKQKEIFGEKIYPKESFLDKWREAEDEEERMFGAQDNRWLGTHEER